MAEFTPTGSIPIPEFPSVADLQERRSHDPQYNATLRCLEAVVEATLRNGGLTTGDLLRSAFTVSRIYGHG